MFWAGIYITFPIFVHRVKEAYCNSLLYVVCVVVVVSSLVSSLYTVYCFFCCFKSSLNVKMLINLQSTMVSNFMVTVVHDLVQSVCMSFVCLRLCLVMCCLVFSLVQHYWVNCNQIWHIFLLGLCGCKSRIRVYPLATHNPHSASSGPPPPLISLLFHYQMHWSTSWPMKV